MDESLPTEEQAMLDADGAFVHATPAPSPSTFPNLAALAAEASAFMGDRHFIDATQPFSRAGLINIADEDLVVDDLPSAPRPAPRAPRPS